MKISSLNFFSIKRKINYYIFRPWQKLLFAECGKKSFIYKPVLLTGKRNIHLGNYVCFREGSRIEVISEYCGEKYKSKLTIGNNVSFENDAHISCVGCITIGDNCVFSVRAMILSEMHSYDDVGVNVLHTKLKHADVEIGKNCFFGADVKVFPGVKIGENVIAGSNTIINHDVPPYSVVVGAPARIIKRYNFSNKRWEKA